MSDPAGDVKWIAGDGDYDSLEWHDARIHAIGFDTDVHELLLDLDYIVRWLGPCGGDAPFEFLTAPATLVFRDVSDLRIDAADLGGIYIMRITRAPHAPPGAAYPDLTTEREWSIELVNGSMTFRSTGFTQYLRREPIRNTTQTLGTTERGGIGFGRTAARR